MTTLKVAKVLSSTPLDDTDVCSTLTDFLASEQDKLHTHQRHGYWNDLMAVAGTMATDPAQEQALQDILDREQLQPAEDDDAATGEGVDDHLAYSAPSAGQTNVGFVQPAMKREEEDDDDKEEDFIPKQEEITPKEEEDPRLKEESSPKSEKRSAKKDKKAAKKAKKAKKEAKKEKKRKRTTL